MLAAAALPGATVIGLLVGAALGAATASLAAIDGFGRVATVIGCAALVGALAASVAVVVRRALRDTADEEEAHAIEAESRAFREVGNVDTIGAGVASLFWERELWIKRRVEQIAIADRSMAQIGRAH